MKSELAYGIDFGTTNSTISFVRNGHAETVPLDTGAKQPDVFRSVMYIRPDSTITFAHEAIDNYLRDIAKNDAKVRKQIFTGQFIQLDKPIIGDGGWAGVEMVPEMIEVDVGEEGRLLMGLKSALSTNIIPNMNIYGRFYSLERLLGIMLAEMKKRADKIVGENVTSAVVGRPVHFVGENDALAQERLTEAVHIAGFTDIRFEFEPIGAAWDYGTSVTDRKHKVIVFDFGGGTLDFSIVSFPEHEIIYNDGIGIGGDLINTEFFEAQIAQYFGSEATFGTSKMPLPSAIRLALKNWYSISQLKTENFLQMLSKLRDATDQKEALGNLRTLVVHNLGYALYQSIDNAKIALSDRSEYDYQFEYAAIDIKKGITRPSFEQSICHIVDEISNKIDEIQERSHISWSEVDYVVTTGGSSLIPIVRFMLEAKIGKGKLVKQETFTSVAKGLALRANS